MPRVPGRRTRPEPAPERRPLTAAGFAERFQRASPTLGCIAAAVLGDRSGVDDALQEAAMIALGKLSDFDQDSHFTAWMATIVRYVSLNHARRRQRAHTTSTDPLALEALNAEPPALSSAHLMNGRGDLEPDQQEFDDRVLLALRTLEETVRCCLLLRTVRDMPYKEIALALSIPEGTAMSHVHRARARLRELLSPTNTPEASHFPDPNTPNAGRAASRFDDDRARL